MSVAPLQGLKVLEIESIGPGPFAAMLLADLGANVLRIGRPSTAPRLANPVLDRGRAARLTLDLKSDAGQARLRGLLPRADVLLEGFRPGVMEKLSLGPDTCLAINSRLVYGRITGWGREGPLAHTAGHDINYIALSGVLHSMGTQQSGPIPPLNLVGDFGGGGLLSAFGIVAAVLEARATGKGQIVDTAMLHGSALLMAMIHGMRLNGRWTRRRAENIFDGSAYFYRCYRCADGGWVAVGAIEEPFRRELFGGLGLAGEADSLLRAPATDAAVHARLEALFLSHSRAYWQDVFADTDACVTPVLDLDEAPRHAQNQASGVSGGTQGDVHTSAARQFGSGTPPATTTRAELLRAWDLAEDPAYPP